MTDRINLHLQREDRRAPNHEPRTRWWAWLVGGLIAIALVGFLIIPLSLQVQELLWKPAGTPRVRHYDPMKDGDINAFLAADPDADIARMGGLLLQASCNRPATIDIVRRLNGALRFKEAVAVGSHFLADCDRDIAVAWPVAYATFQLSDFKGTIALFEQYSEHVAQDPSMTTYAAFSFEKLGRHEEAAKQFERALLLFSDIKNVHIQQFIYASNAQKAVGNACRAAQVLNWYVSVDSGRQAPGWLKTRVRELEQQGNCASDAPVGEKVIKYDPVGKLLAAQVSLNGTRGAASLEPDVFTVRIRKDFAVKSGIRLEPGSRVRTSGDESGEAYFLSRADIELDGITAKDVLVAIPESAEVATAGADVVLGQSFLSQFSWRAEGDNLILSGRPK